MKKMTVSKETFTSAAGPIHVDVYVPPSSGKHAGVLVLHGTLGLDPPFGADIESFAEGLAKKGIAAAIPKYFESTGTTPGNDALTRMLEHLAAWKATCAQAVAFLAADPRFDAARIGLLGFSLGGHLALDLSMNQPGGASIKAVVDFFAPTLQPKLQGKWSAMPPVLVHHGTADPLPIENSIHLVRELERSGRRVSRFTFGTPATPPGPTGNDQFIEYPGEKHGFTGAALLWSRDTTLQFLGQHLK
jgi:dienelactone hydrolase